MTESERNESRGKGPSAVGEGGGDYGRRGVTGRSRRLATLDEGRSGSHPGDPGRSSKRTEVGRSVEVEEVWRQSPSVEGWAGVWGGSWSGQDLRTLLPILQSLLAFPRPLRPEYVVLV